MFKGHQFVTELKLSILEEIDIEKLNKTKLCYELSIVLNISFDIVWSKCLKFNIENISKIKDLCHLGYKLMDAIEFYEVKHLEKISTEDWVFYRKFLKPVF